MKLGDTASFERTITDDDVRAFAVLSGDMNPLHLDDAYAKQTPFGRRIVHGMFLGALCSRLVGMYLPGEKCLYVSQELRFHSPVFIGDTVTVSGAVGQHSESTGIAEVDIIISTRGIKCCSGIAKVKELV